MIEPRKPCPRCDRHLRLFPNANLALCEGCGWPHEDTREERAEGFLRCPDCDCVLDFKAGVLLCHACGYSECG